MNDENKKHPHAELIKAWADGATIQWYDACDNKWRDVSPTPMWEPMWEPEIQYRIKPEAAAERVKAALKGDVPDANVGKIGKDNNIPTIDGKPLTDGEKALITAIRRAEKITVVYDYQTTVLVSANDNASGVYAYRKHIAFLTASSDTDDEAIIAALDQIKAEQEVANEAK